MATVKGVCPTCDGLRTLFHPEGDVAFETCPECKGTGEVDYELERGLKVTLLSGPDKYPYHMVGVPATPNCIVVVPDEVPEDDESWPGNRILTRRSDGQWRERGKTKKSGGIWKFGIAEEYRSREA